mmetsp:Transcript_14340/g.45123  ORF Transcript_14340/g.45123 Transcript_14340/m.45123 type:complete len:204 (-) Transcript_14340:70-681(-)
MVVELPPSFGRSSHSSRRSTVLESTGSAPSPFVSRRSTIFDASAPSSVSASTSSSPSDAQQPATATPTVSRRNTRKLSRAAELPISSTNHLNRSSSRDAEVDAGTAASRPRRPSTLSTSTSANSLSAGGLGERRPSRLPALEHDAHNNSRRSSLSTEVQAAADVPSADAKGGRRRPSARRGNASQPKGSHRSPLAATAEAGAR